MSPIGLVPTQRQSSLCCGTLAFAASRRSGGRAPFRYVWLGRSATPQCAVSPFSLLASISPAAWCTPGAERALAPVRAHTERGIQIHIIGAEVAVEFVDERGTGRDVV